MKGLVFLVGFAVVAVVGYLALRQHKNTSELLGETAARLGLQRGSAAVSAYLSPYAAVGEIGGLPVWIGTAPSRRGRRVFHYLQVVVGRHPGATVGPQPVGRASAAPCVPFDEVEHAVRATTSAAERSDARCSRFDGADIEVTPDLVVRTFTVPGIQSQRWARRVLATTRVLVAYAASHAPRR